MRIRFSYWMAIGCAILVGYGQQGYAQALGEDAGVRWIYGELLRKSVINNDYGLGRLSRLYNEPATYISRYNWNSKGGLTPQNSFGQLITARPWGTTKDIQIIGSLWNEWDLSSRLVWHNRTENWNKQFPDGSAPFTEFNQEIFINGHLATNKIDKGGDHYLDQPQKQRLWAVSKTSIRKKHYYIAGNFKYFYLNENGGRTSYDRSIDYLTDSDYGEGQKQEHIGADINSIINLSKDDHINLTLLYDYTNLDRYWGTRLYNAKDHVVDFDLDYHLNLGNNLDDFYFGLKYDFRDVQEILSFAGEETLELSRRENSIMGSFEFRNYLQPRVLLKGGGSVGLHNIGGIAYSPHLELVYTIKNGMGITLFGNGGMRYANPLDEYASLLRSNRDVEVVGELDREEVWSYGVSYQNSMWTFYDIHWVFKFEAAQKHYLNYVLADLDSQPYSILFYNTNARQTVVNVNNSFSWRGFVWGTSYRFDFLRARTLNGGMPRVALNPMHRIGTDLSWRLRHYSISPVTVSSSFYVLGHQRFPDVSMKPNWNNFEYKQWQTRWDLKMDFLVSDIFQWDALWGFDAIATIGVDNILGNYRKTPYLNGNMPFSREFDGGLTNQGILGRRFYASFKVIF